MFFIYRVLYLISIFFFFFSVKETPLRSAVEIDFDWKKGRT